MLVLGVCTSGCATLGWRYFPNTRTYHYEREVTVDVQSFPEGATVYEDGKAIGTAPLRHRTRHQVKRVRKSHSGVGIALGCVADAPIAYALFDKWGSDIGDGPSFNYFGTTQQKLLFTAGAVVALDCWMLALMTGIEYLMHDGSNGHEFAAEPVWRRDRVSEKIVPRTVTLEARWPDWSPVQSTIVVPDRSLVTFRRGHAGTFDDALVRRARAGAPLSQDGLLRAGRTYQRMAGETHDPEHARAAISYYEQYLKGDVAVDRRAEVEASITELRRLGAKR
jgi:hypothetical protein